MSIYGMKTSCLVLLMMLSAPLFVDSLVELGKDEFSGRLHGSTHTVLHSMLRGAHDKARHGENTVRTSLAGSVFVNIEANWTNATLAEVVCAQVDFATTSISISAEEGDPYLELPFCINASLVALQQLEVTHVLINDISVLPSYIGTLRFFNSTIADWSENGVSWPTFWTQLPFISQFLLNDCNVAGSLGITPLPTTMRTFDASKNSITGPVPGSLFANLAASGPSTFTFIATDNLLSGPIEENWLSSLSGMESIMIRLTNNKLSQLPLSLFGPSNFSALISVALYIDSNELSGQLETQPWFANWTLGWQKSIAFVLSKNRLNGTLPSRLCYGSIVGSPIGGASFILDDNTMSGELSPTLLDGCGPTSLYLSNNRIGGSLPNELVFNVSGSFRLLVLTGNQLTDFPGDSISTSAAQIVLMLDLNNLSRIPSDEALGSISWVQLSFSGNQEIGKPKFNPELGTWSSRAAPSGLAYQNGGALFFANCSFHGPLPDFEVTLEDGQKTLSCPTYLNISYNNFVGPIPPSWSECTAATTDITKMTYALDFSYNPGVFGPIPQKMWDFSSFPNANNIPLLAPVSFLFENTSLSGTMPIVSYPNETNSYRTFLLFGSNSDVDFCSVPSSYPNSTRPEFYIPPDEYQVSCNLNYTNACECPELWPGCDTSICRPKSQSSCDPKTQPSPDFYCFNGTWTTTSSLTTPALTVPAGQTVTIFGNLTTSQVIIPPGGGSIIVEGCANVSEVVIQLSEEALKKGKTSQTVITSLGNCGNLDTTAIKTTGTTGCKKVRVERGNVSHSSLSVLFSVDTTSCNLWWIILASVLALLLISGVILTILLLSRRKANTPASRMVRDDH